MEQSYPHPMRSNHDVKESANRSLRRLRILLLIWLISLMATVLWYSLSVQTWPKTSVEASPYVMNFPLGLKSAGLPAEVCVMRRRAGILILYYLSPLPPDQNDSQNKPQLQSTQGLPVSKLYHSPTLVIPDIQVILTKDRFPSTNLLLIQLSELPLHPQQISPKHPKNRLKRSLNQNPKSFVDSTTA